MAKATDDGHIKGPVFIPSCAAVRLIWTLPNGKQGHNILHGSYTTFALGTQANVNTLATAIFAGLGSSALNAQLATTTTLLAVGVRDMAQVSPGVGHGEIISNIAGVLGTAAGDALPNNVAFVVSLKTGLSLQANRGRVYIPGFAEAANGANGQANAAVGTAAVAFVTAIQSAMTAQGLTLCIAHPARKAYTGAAGAPHLDRPAGTVQVTSIASINNVWDSTRLRKIK